MDELKNDVLNQDEGENDETEAGSPEKQASSEENPESDSEEVNE